MKQLIFPYQFVRVPKAVRRARLDNIALVPASLLPKKGKYQTIANNLPKGSVLICQSETTQKISHILERVANLMRENGHMVKTLVFDNDNPTRFATLHSAH